MTEVAHLSRRKIKRMGAHYTPRELAAFLAERAAACLGNASGRPIRVLDPACGDGSLLRAISEALAGRAVVLSGYDTDTIAVERARQKLPGANIKLADFLMASGVRAADLVISNPPYVRTQALGAKRSRELARRFSLRGRVDLYHAFVRAMSAALTDGGVLALLTSNRFMSIQSGAAMRELLREQFDLREVYDLGDTKFFRGAAVLPAIVVAQKRAERGATLFCRVYQTPPAPAISFDHVLDAVRDPDAIAARVESTFFAVERGHLVGELWRLESDESRGWLQTVKNQTACRFGDVAQVRVGIKTTADNVFIRDDWDALPPHRRPEEALLRPLITHEVAARWRIGDAPKTRVLYPHTTDAHGKRVAVDLADYPGAAAYLQTHRAQLAGRKYVSDAGRAWYEIWVPQQPRDWDKPKIVYPDIAQSPTFFLDRSGAVVNGDCYWITLRDGVDDPRWLYLMLAIANSTFIERFYDHVFHNKLYAGRRRFMAQYVRHFPLPALDGPVSAQIIDAARARAGGGVEVDTDALVWSAFGLPASDRPGRGARG